MGSQRRKRPRRSRAGGTCSSTGGAGRRHTRGNDDVAAGHKRGGMAKYIFVTGGVVSALGKGITAASIGRLLKGRGLKVTIQKFDPYINVDPGTMSPYQHGEVFVTDDGAETDLDLGHYERFIDEVRRARLQLDDRQDLQSVIQKERRGDYLGRTVQVIPHITNEIKDAHAPRRRRQPTSTCSSRGRRHGRRHREPAVPRGHPPVPQGRRPRQRRSTSTSRSCRSSARPASSRRSRRSTACAELRGDRHPARHPLCRDRSALIADIARQDRPVLRRRARKPSSRPTTLDASTRCRSSWTTRASTTLVVRKLGSARGRAATSPTGARSSSASTAATSRVTIALVGKYVQLHDAYLSV